MPADLHSISSSTAPLKVADALSGRHVLVTGVTGFTGKVWLVFLLERVPDVGRISVLVRPGREASAEERFRRMAERSPAFRPLRERYGAELGPWLAERVRVVEGDVAKPLCGVDEEGVDALASLDAVVHFAGLTDFDPDPAEALSCNVRGVQHAADLAHRTGARLLHISSAFVAGNVSGVVPERLERGVSPNDTAFDVDGELRSLEDLCADADPSDRDGVKARRAKVGERARELGWPNIYTYTKALAEHLLAGHAARTTVVRPSIIECARTTPFSGWNEGLNTTGPLMWLISSWFRHFPAQPDHHFDVVPVDTVARGVTLILAAALTDRAEAGYHLGSSQTNPLHFDRAVELNNLAVRAALGRPDAKPADRFLRRFLDTTNVGDRDHLLALPRLRKAARGVRRALDGVDVKGWVPPKLYDRVGETVEDSRDLVSMYLGQTERGLKRLERMLDLYKPFIHDNDYVFATDHVRSLSAALPDEEAEAFGWDIDDVDWRTYWMEVLYPGIHRWCLPILRGEAAPEDPPMDPPLELTEPEGERREASR